VKVNRQHYRDILLAAIKHVAEDNFAFQQDSALAHCVHNTVHLPQHEISTSFFLNYDPKQPRAESH